MPSPRLAVTADASTQLSISEFLQLCFAKHPFRRTVSRQLHEDISDAHCPRNSGNKRDATFADARHAALLCRVLRTVHPLQGPSAATHPTSPTQDIGTIHSFSSSSSNSGTIPVPRTQRDCTPPPPPGLEAQTLLGISHNIPSKAAPVRHHSHHGPSFTSPGTLTPPTSPPTLQPQVSNTQVGTYYSLYSYPHKECWYRPCGSPLCHWCRSTRWSWSIPQAHAYHPTHGTLRTA